MPGRFGRQWIVARLVLMNQRLGLVGSGRAHLVGDFADLEAGESADGDVLSKIGDGLIDLFAAGHGLILYEGLFVGARFPVELLHLASDDLIDDGVRLAGSPSLGGVNFAFLLAPFGG